MTVATPSNSTRKRAEFCKRGHARTPENVTPHGACRICVNAASTARRPQRKAYTAAYNAAYHAANKERLKTECRKRYSENRERYAISTSKWRRENREANISSARKSRLRIKYGLTPESWEALFIAQDRRCAICRRDDAQSWHTDHDHATNKVRGILCRNCNTGIGLLQDNPLVIDKAASYLRAHGK